MKIEVAVQSDLLNVFEISIFGKVKVNDRMIHKTAPVARHPLHRLTSWRWEKRKHTTEHGSVQHVWCLHSPAAFFFILGHTNFAIEFIQVNEFSIFFFFSAPSTVMYSYHRRCYSMKCALRYLRPFAVVHKS